MDDTIKNYSLELRIILLTVGKHFREAVERRMQAMGLELGFLQFSVLRVLSVEDNLSLKDLSQLLHVDPSTLVKTLDSLEKRGLIHRERDTKDRRRIVITLAPQGREVMPDLETIREDDPVYQAMAQIGVEESEQLVELLRKLVQHMPHGDAMMDSICQRVRVAQASV
jgi:DNA-binding MarR family transcriptional regulator